MSPFFHYPEPNPLTECQFILFSGEAETETLNLADFILRNEMNLKTISETSLYSVYKLKPGGQELNEYQNITNLVATSKKLEHKGSALVREKFQNEVSEAWQRFKSDFNDREAKKMMDLALKNCSKKKTLQPSITDMFQRKSDKNLKKTNNNPTECGTNAAKKTLKPDTLKFSNVRCSSYED